MSDATPTPPPPLPSRPADEAARAAAAAAPEYEPATDPDDTGVPTLRGDLDDIGRGFLSALFDLSFKTFITRRLASAFYLVGLIAIAIGFIVYLVSGVWNSIEFLTRGSIGAGVSLLIATVILVPIVTFLAIVVLRFIIEGIVALIAIAENTQQTAQNTEND